MIHETEGCLSCCENDSHPIQQQSVALQKLPPLHLPTPVVARLKDQ